MIAHKLIPLGGITQDDVHFRHSSPNEMDELAKATIERPLTSNKPPFFLGESFSQSVSSPIFHETPATQLAYAWLKDDLKDVGWID